MTIEIKTDPFHLNLYGYSGIAVNKNYQATAFALMDKMWQTVKSAHLQNKGLNIWVYESNENVFAGVELTFVPDYDTGLESKSITLLKYAYYKHIGSYSLIKQAGLTMRKQLNEKGFTMAWPYIEIYGNWTSDETKLETELLVCLQ